MLNRQGLRITRIEKRQGSTILSRYFVIESREWFLGLIPFWVPLRDNNTKGPRLYHCVSGGS